MPNDSTITHRMHKAEKRVNADGYTYTIQFYVATNDDLPTYELPYRSPVPSEWVAQSDWPDEFTQPYIVDTLRTSFTPRDEPPYVVTVTAVTRNFDVIIGGISLDDQMSLGFEKRPHTLPLSFWGARLATKDDGYDAVTNNTGAGRLSFTINDDGKSVVVGSRCNVGDLVFNNAPPFGGGTSSVSGTDYGSASYKDSEFSTTDHPPYGLMGKPVKLTVAKINFLTTDDPARYYEFQGVNGDIPSVFKIPRSTDEGKWRVEQSLVDPTTFPQNGKLTKCHAVRREILLAPSIGDADSTWKAGFGTWSWRL